MVTHSSMETRDNQGQSLLNGKISNHVAKSEFNLPGQVLISLNQFMGNVLLPNETSNKIITEDVIEGTCSTMLRQVSICLFVTHVSVGFAFQFKYKNV
ncbi:hypothetical protein NC652_019615 [Populus alba x Populus x berolinensis]|nr:hypothetical protein NC652_019615 [Populus alba x Populus x berolinensis]